MQFERDDYNSEQEVRLRDFCNNAQYVAALKALSDAEQGGNRYFGVSSRGNGKWQARVTGKVVRTSC